MKTNTLLKVDMGASLIMLTIVVFSIFSNNFSIFPNMDQRILGMNNFGLVLLSINHVLAGIGIVFIYKSWVFYTILKSYPELEVKILAAYQIKWGIFLLIIILPYAYNHKPHLLFLLLHLFLFLIFVYKGMAKKN